MEAAEFKASDPTGHLIASQISLSVGPVSILKINKSHRAKCSKTLRPTSLTPRHGHHRRDFGSPGGDTRFAPSDRRATLASPDANAYSSPRLLEQSVLVACPPRDSPPDRVAVANLPRAALFWTFAQIDNGEYVLISCGRTIFRAAEQSRMWRNWQTR